MHADRVGVPGTHASGALLIVNADDFGLTSGVCRGILRGHRDGVVTSTSALVNAPAFDAHARALLDSGLPVGGHLAVVGEDPPLLSAREVPSLVDGSGRFATTWQGFVRRAARGAVDTDDLRREFAAQMDKLDQAGLRPTHLDSHQNLHLWPQVSSALFELAAERNIGAVRVPRRAQWNLTAAAVEALSRLLQRHARRAGLSFPAASIGLDEADASGGAGLAPALDRLGPAPTAELVVHAGEEPDTDRLRYVTRFAWGDQLDAVCGSQARDTIAASGFRLGSFADLAPSGAPELAPPTLTADEPPASAAG